jgi:hypothetical protein
MAITAMCHVNDFGFLFLFRNNHCIGYSDYKGQMMIPWMGQVNTKGDKEGTKPLFDHPSSICYAPLMKKCCLIEAGGTKIKSLEISSKYCTKMSLTNSFQKYFSRMSSVNLINTSCDIDNDGNLYWAIRELHRCLKLNSRHSIVENFVGNGHSNFSVVNDLGLCSLSSPSGIKCVGSNVYLADEGNHCIRAIKDGEISMVLGSPLNDNILDSPSQVKCHSNVLYVVDKNKVKYIALSDKSFGTLYTASQIVAIENGPKRDLYILEMTVI